MGEHCGVKVCISIHALREESDAGTYRQTDSKKISIHALREESDSKPVLGYGQVNEFQSTLSVRRAT